MSSFFTENELQNIGFKSIGENVLISRKASIYQADCIEIGNNVRIDDFCFLSGQIVLHSNIHIAPYSSLIGGTAGIEMYDFSGLSSHISIYAASDDYSGRYLTNPTVPSKYKNLIESKVVLQKHVIVGTGSCVLPGVTIAEGCSIGAMSLVSKSTEPWGIYVGIPLRKVKDRLRDLLFLEKEYWDDQNTHST